ncbi:MAG: ComEC/Rec2 family competence protein [Malacoplasma sp.]|nr:ComEC/Rec2 family competence protein [Malacoplasma sp.]
MKIIKQLSLWMLICCFYFDNLILSLFLIAFFLVSFLINKIKKIHLFLLFLIGFFYLVFIAYIYKNESFDFLNVWINKILTFDLRNKINEYFVNIHGTQTGSFLSLILLNIKNNQNINLYYKLVDLSVVHLIVISGYHINIFCFLILKIFFKFPKTGKILCIVFSFFISYLNGFSPSTIRIFLSLIFYSFNKTKNYSTDLSIIAIALIAPKVISSFGLCMSFLGARGVKLFAVIKEKNILYNTFFTSFFAIIYIVPYIAMLNNQMSLWGIFFGILFTPIFTIIYFLSLLFSWWMTFSIMFQFTYQFINNISQTLNNMNIFIEINFLTNWWIIGFYYSLIEFFNLFLKHKRKVKKWYLKDLKENY